jgi:hypothetical protein
MKNSSDTIENRSRDLPACSAVPQPTAPPRAPSGVYMYVCIYMCVCVCVCVRNYCSVIIPHRCWNDSGHICKEVRTASFLSIFYVFLYSCRPCWVFCLSLQLDLINALTLLVEALRYKPEDRGFDS